MATSADRERPLVKPLDGKVAIVTGVSSPVGIGAAVARRLAGSGARLLVAADASPGEISKECADLLGDAKAVLPFTVDLGDSAAVTAMVAEAEKRFGRVDLLVNNAAVRINRRIVHVASQLGSVAYQTRTIYGMTKAALIHLAKSMALELATENIQVNTVSPGPIATQPTLDRQRDDPDEAARRLEYVPMRRYGRPEEIGEVVHWLLTTDASFLTGHDLIIDGGYTIH